MGGVANREQRSRSRSRRGGVSEKQIAGAAAARLFFLTAVAIAIATRPFKFHEISVSNTSRSFVSSIHSFGYQVATLIPTRNVAALVRRSCRDATKAALALRSCPSTTQLHAT